MGTDPSSKGSQNEGIITYAPNASVWIPSPVLAWLQGKVVSQENDILVVKVLGDVDANDKLLRFKAIQCHPRDDDPRGVDDVTHLSFLHEPGLLQNLSMRYDVNEIYTYTGSILIAVNPFANIPHLYSDAMKEQYLGAPLGAQAPHVFAIADSAYRAMISENRSQSILISGESGAGKTETTKLVMDYLATACGRDGSGASDIRQIESLVLESNPILEAFGNAKTERNNNSSRFGKFIKVQFDSSGRVSGAGVKSYLLEKSRVVRIGPGERNYHVFYQLCEGLTNDEANKFHMDGYSARDFYYLNQSDCFEIEGSGNSAEFHKLKRSLTAMGIMPEEQDAMFRIVAGILHLGNIRVEMDESEDFVRVVPGKAEEHLRRAADLLGITKEDLAAAILYSTMRAIRESMLVPVRDVLSAESRRDSLAKNLYSTLFDWIVVKINDAIGEDKSAQVFIGVLDIYGFEHFKTNSFEQFCINFANEKLQQHFNFHVLKTEQEEYEKEKINWSRIPFTDNQDCLDLIEAHRGFLSLLDNACLVESTDAEMFTRKLFMDFGRHKRLTRPRVNRTEFILSHFAGDVAYCTDEFIVKNKDAVIAEHFDLLSSSRDPHVAHLFPKTKQGGKNKFFSLGNSFKQQLGKLMEDINNTEPHYIRCIKPNNVKKPKVFESTFVVSQLRSGGVLEAVRMCLAGYPTRQTFGDFLGRFKVLLPSNVDETTSEADQCHHLLKFLDLEGYQVGLSKVFLRSGHMIDLETERMERLNACQYIVDFVLGVIERKKAAAVIVTYLQRFEAEKDHRNRVQENAASVVQSYFKMYVARKRYTALQSACLLLQCSFRSAAAWKLLKLRRQQNAATKIQSKWRQQQAARPLKKLRLLVKGWKAKKLYQKLLEEKKERERIEAERIRKELERIEVERLEKGRLERERVEKERVERDRVERERAEREHAEKERLQGEKIAGLSLENGDLAVEKEIEVEEAESEAAVAVEDIPAAKSMADGSSCQAEPSEGPPAAAEEPVKPVDPYASQTIQNIKFLVIKRLKEKAEKVQEQTKESLKVVQKENEALKLQLTAREEELASLQEKLQKSQHMAFAAAAVAEAVNKGMKEGPKRATSESPPSKPRARSVGPEPQKLTLGRPAVGLEPSLEQTVFAKLQESMEEAKMASERLKEENLRLLEQKTAADAMVKRAEEKVHMSAQEIEAERQAAQMRQEVQDALASRVQELERSLADKDQEIRVLATHFLSSKAAASMDPLQQMESLIKAVGGKMLGFSPEGHPVAAALLQRSLMYWGAFDGTGNSVFNCVVNTVKVAEKATDPNVVVYWLSTTASLYCLVQEQEKKSVSAAAELTDRFRANDIAYGIDAFKLQLWFCIVHQYRLIRDSTRAKLLNLLRGDASALGGAKAPSGLFSKKLISKTFFQKDKASVSYFLSVTNVLGSFLAILEDFCVPKLISRDLLRQLIRFVMGKVFNNLLNRSKWCPCNVSNGLALKSALEKVRSWLAVVEADFQGFPGQSGPPLEQELQRLDNAASFLVLEDKPNLTVEKIKEVCPGLTANQLWHICNNYEDEEYPGPSKKVLQHLGDSNKVPELIQDEREIPFSAPQMVAVMAPFPVDSIEIPADILMDGNLLFLMPSTRDVLFESPMNPKNVPKKSPAAFLKSFTGNNATPPSSTRNSSRAGSSAAIHTPMSKNRRKHDSLSQDVMELPAVEDRQEPQRLIFDSVSRVDSHPSR